VICTHQAGSRSVPFDGILGPTDRAGWCRHATRPHVLHAATSAWKTGERIWVSKGRSSFSRWTDRLRDFRGHCLAGSDLSNRHRICGTGIANAAGWTCGTTRPLSRACKVPWTQCVALVSALPTLNQAWLDRGYSVTIKGDPSHKSVLF